METRATCAKTSAEIPAGIGAETAEGAVMDATFLLLPKAEKYGQRTHLSGQICILA